MSDFVIKWNGKDYPLDRKDFTVGRLRQFKQWFGLDYGRYHSFIVAFSLLDAEAVLCALWTARKRAGEDNVPDPNQMDDFEILGLIEDGDKATEGNGNPPTREQPQTPDSTEIPTSSETEHSDPSPTSAT